MTIPVTVLTGFLGSGKTTILAEILNRLEFSRTAVIINEFGEIGIDHELIETSEESLVQLTTGCLCCLAGDDFSRTLIELWTRRDLGEINAFDRVIVETSGLADPVPVAHALIRIPTVAEHFRLERIVTTVDVLTAKAALYSQPESIKQVALADRILLTKSDIDSTSLSLKELSAELRQLNQTAPIKDRWQCTDVVDYLFNNDAIPVDTVDHETQIRRIERLGEIPVADHATTVNSVVIERERPIAAAALTLFLEALAEHCGGDLLRLKGLVSLRERPDQPYVLHGVQHVFHSPVWLNSWPGADQRTRLVLLGKGLSGPWIDALFDAICAEVDEVVQNG